jgi:hypothetical protein
VPSGLYRLADGATEQFRCAPGPMGWRYFSTVQSAAGVSHVDLSVDAGWRPVRVRIQTPDHHLLLSARGSILDDEQLVVSLTGDAVDFASPCFPLATVRRLSGSGEIDAIVIDGETLQPSTEQHRFEMGEEEEVATPVGQFVARAYRHIAPRPHFSRVLWIAGDVVVAGDGLELTAYDPGGQGPQPLS